MLKTNNIDDVTHAVLSNLKTWYALTATKGTNATNPHQFLFNLSFSFPSMEVYEDIFF